MKNLYILLLILSTFQLFSQQERVGDSLAVTNVNSGSSIGKLSIGGYAQIDYNQVVGADNRSNGKLDVHRMVLTMGYLFNSKTRFFVEIEYEHVKKVYVEQAYLNYRFNKSLNLKAGLLLIPMGIINEYHEPPTFNGVERPNVDKNIVPTTWREIGAGITGRFDDVSLKYQLYVVNGFNGYNETGKLRGNDGLRNGRQKGAESFISTPNISAKLDYFGLSGLKLGLSGYFGKTQSSLLNGLDESNDSDVARADSSVVNVNMIGLDARYNTGGLQLKGQYIISNLGNTNEYNVFTGNDLGSVLQGFYIEAGYNVFQSLNRKDKLIPFFRYEKYNTHQKTEGNLEQNDAYDKSEFVFGLGWKVADGAVFKADMQLIKSAADDDTKKQFNMGVGIWF